MTTALPLTVFEEFVLWEDRPAYPWSAFMRMHFTGRLDRAALTAALQTTLVRHPLLRSKVEERKRGRCFWVPVNDPQPTIQWIDGPVGGPFPPARHLDLRQEIGLRIFVVCDADHSELILQFHHACCDGLGMIAFIRELVVAYAQKKGEKVKRGALRRLDTRRLANRGKYGLTFWKLLKKAPRQMIGLIGAKEFLLHSPAPVVPCAAKPDDDPPPDGYPATCCHHFDAQESAELHALAKNYGVTLNELLVRDLFLAIHQWRDRLEIQNDRQWLRMMIPVNLRTFGDQRLSAANVVSSVYLDRRKSDFDKPDELLRGIHQQMQVIKDNELGLTFIFSLQVAKYLPGGLRKTARRDKCSVSCILTNLGRVFSRPPVPTDEGRMVLGDVRLDRFDILAPFRPYNVISFATHSYANRLSLALHYDPRPITAAQASDLLEGFVARLRAAIHRTADATTP